MLMFLVVHQDIVLREASRAMFLEERAISAVKNVDLWICEARVISSISRAILLADKGGPVSKY
jgi:hypothetical protein